MLINSLFQLCIRFLLIQHPPDPASYTASWPLPAHTGQVSSTPSPFFP